MHSGVQYQCLKYALRRPWMMGTTLVEEPTSNAQRYVNCMAASWEPSCEGHSWINKEATIFSWVDEPSRNRIREPHIRMCIVQGLQTESKIYIPSAAKPHLLEYMTMQSEAMDNSRLDGDVDVNT
jgi:hypothetical protein